MCLLHDFLIYAVDALALAGVDYMVLSGRIVEALEKAATLQGYNDGLSADLDEVEGVSRQLSEETAQQVGQALRWQLLC